MSRCLCGFRTVTRTLLLTGLRDLVRRPLHTGLMVLGVALGVAVVIAIDLANAAAQRGFARSTEAVVGRATHQVQGGPSGIPQDLLRRLRVEGGLRQSAPVVEGVVSALDFGRRPLRVLGIDPLSEGPFRGHLAGGAAGRADFAPFFTEPDAVLIGEALAQAQGLALGQRLRVQVDGRLASLRVIGIVRSADEQARRGLDGLLLMDVGAAQRLFALGDRLTRIDLIADQAALERLRPLLPEGARLVAASEQAGAAGQLTAAFQLNLTALSLLALVVGMFLIYNTVMFSVVQRRAVFGTLRALGAEPRQVLALILAEAAVASAVGAGLGVLLGFVLGQGAVRLVTQTINDLYFVLSVRQAELSLPSVARGLLLGVGAGVLAALAPALEAARVEPVSALRPSAWEGATRRLWPRVAVAGGLLALLGGGLLGLAEGSLLLSFAGLFGIVLGLALLTPAGTAGLMALLGPLAGALFGTLGRLAARTVTRAVARTGVAVAALMVAIAVTIGVALMIGSFRATVESWLGLALRADVYVSAPPAGAGAAPTLPPELRARVAAVPGVAEVESVRLAEVASPRGPVHVAVSDAPQGRSERLYRFAEGSPRAAWERVRAGAVLVSEPFAHRLGLPPHGGRVQLFTERGLREFEVAGIYYDYATERGTVLMHRDTWERCFDDRALTSLAAWAAPGTSADELAQRLRGALAGSALEVTPNASLRRTALKIFDRTFAVTQALRLLAVVVAFIGVWSALMALTVERTRELATLQALGLTPGQLLALTSLETGFMGLAAGLFSLPTGLLLAVILVDVINVRSFGWTMTLVLDPWVFAQALAVALSAALLAGLYPLARLLRRPVAAALRQE